MKNGFQFFGSLVDKNFGIENLQSHSSDPLAQLVARFLDMEKVRGSSPLRITNFQQNQQLTFFSFGSKWRT